jgi:hypothetical protein
VCKASGYEGVLVMEHMPNGSLDHVLQNMQQETPPRFWAETEIAAGLEFMHSQ